jgi:F-box/leucine-rich repeat protein 10/11
VIEVSTQSELPGWNLLEYSQYFDLPVEQRRKVLNVISLEFSDTRMEELIVRPDIVREMDWVTRLWPQSRRKEGDYPKVLLYCLISGAESYTDFHIDFGGSTVFYHIVRGSKRFYFVPPTPENLKKYQQWSSTSYQVRSLVEAEPSLPRRTRYRSLPLLSHRLLIQNGPQ